MLRILVIAAVAWLCWRVVAGVLRGAAPRTRLRCGTCRHFGSEFDDGVICRFGGRETFKSAAAVATCGTWEQRGG